jgi:uncharacterized alkaline shock family protein YloU
MMATISSDILASYAADAALEVHGVRGLVGSPRQRGVRVLEEHGRISLELHIALDWGVSVREVGCEVQRRVGDYLGRMARVELEAVNVVVREIGRE